MKVKWNLKKEKRTSVGLVAGDHRDLTIGLQDRRAHFFDATASTTAQGTHEFVVSQSLVTQRLRIQLAIVNQHPGVTLDKALDGFALISEIANQGIDGDQRCGADVATHHRVVPAVHGILQGIAQDQQEHQVKRSQLPDLPLSGEPEHDDEKAVNHDSPQDELPPGQAHRPHGTPILGRGSIGNEGR